MALDAARRMMVDGQIRTNDVTDRRILGAFGKVPREKFVPEGQGPIAYLDRDVMTGAGRAMLKPMVLAKLIHAADLGAADHVLDVGCATGYSAAILAEIGAHVVAVESDEACAAVAARTLLDLGYAVTLRRGDLAEGAKADGPFDVILVNGSVEHVPPTLLVQLKDGGRLVCIQRQNGTSRAMLYVSADGDIGHRALFDATAPALPGFADTPQFVF
jgi:protein-L-isoaspartate(D-aspartate) O-methyltransferase